MAFTLEWTSSINKYSLPDNAVFTNSDLHVYHIHNLASNLIKSAAWEPISCSYFNTASNSYQTKDGAYWENIDEMKFCTSMSSDTLDSVRGTGVYDPTPHPWLTLRKIDTSKQTLTYVYMTIDCRYPLPPHESNVGLVLDGDDNNKILNAITDTTDEPDRNQWILGASAFTRKEVQAIKDDSTAYGTYKVFPLEQNLNYFNGLTKRKEDAVSKTFPTTDGSTIEAGSKGQDYNSILTSFVDIVYHKIQPFSGSIYSRPITNTVKTLFDDKSVYTCWGYDSLNQDQSMSEQLGDRQDFYHFHFDPTGPAFIYQVSNNFTGDRDFSSMCGFIPLSNAHDGDKFPYSTLTLNVDPGFDYKSVCFNNVKGTKIKNVNPNTVNGEISPASNLVNLTPNDFKALGQDVVNTFFNTCFRNYNFSNGTSSYSFGTSDDVTKPSVLPCFAPILPSDSTILVRDQKGIEIMFNGASDYEKSNIATLTAPPQIRFIKNGIDIYPNPLQGVSGAADILAETNKSNKITFKTINGQKDGFSGVSGGPYEVVGEKKVSINRILDITDNSILNTSYEVHTVFGDKRILAKSTFGDTSVKTVTLSNAITSSNKVFSALTNTLNYDISLYDDKAGSNLNTSNIIDGNGNKKFKSDQNNTLDFIKNQNVVFGGAEGLPLRLQLTKNTSYSHILANKFLSTDTVDKDGNYIASRINGFSANNTGRPNSDSSLVLDDSNELCFKLYSGEHDGYFYGGGKLKLDKIKTTWNGTFLQGFDTLTLFTNNNVGVDGSKLMLLSSSYTDTIKLGVETDSLTNSSKYLSQVDSNLNSLTPSSYRLERFFNDGTKIKDLSNSLSFTDEYSYTTPWEETLKFTNYNRAGQNFLDISTNRAGKVLDIQSDFGPSESEGIDFVVLPFGSGKAGRISSAPYSTWWPGARWRYVLVEAHKFKTRLMVELEKYLVSLGMTQSQAEGELYEADSINPERNGSILIPNNATVGTANHILKSDGTQLGSAAALTTQFGTTITLADIPTSGTPTARTLTSAGATPTFTQLEPIYFGSNTANDNKNDDSYDYPAGGIRSSEWVAVTGKRIGGILPKLKGKWGDALDTARQGNNPNNYGFINKSTTNAANASLSMTNKGLAVILGLESYAAGDFESASTTATQPGEPKANATFILPTKGIIKTVSGFTFNNAFLSINAMQYFAGGANGKDINTKYYPEGNSTAKSRTDITLGAYTLSNTSFKYKESFTSFKQTINKKYKNNSKDAAASDHVSTINELNFYNVSNETEELTDIATQDQANFYKYWCDRIINKSSITPEDALSVRNVFSSSFGALQTTSDNALSAKNRIAIPNNIPTYIKVPINILYPTEVAWERGERSVLASQWPPYLQVKNSQAKGSNAFSVFKSLIRTGQTPLVATGFAINEDRNTPFTDGSIFGTLKTTTAATTSEQKVLLSNGTKNSSDKTYSELPIFLFSSDGNYPEMKGYVTDIYWGPDGITNGSLVINQDRTKNPKIYSKIYWRGWWLPWVGDETPNWG